MPPPSLFHTVSLAMAAPEPSSRTPPQPTTKGLEAGKSTCALPSLTPSVARLSPEAANTLTPRLAASCKAEVMAVIACWVHWLSAEPQLIDTVEGALAVSWAAWEMASTKPWSVLGAK